MRPPQLPSFLHQHRHSFVRRLVLRDVLLGELDPLLPEHGVACPTLLALLSLAVLRTAAGWDLVLALLVLLLLPSFFSAPSCFWAQSCFWLLSCVLLPSSCSFFFWPAGFFLEAFLACAFAAAEFPRPQRSGQRRMKEAPPPGHPGNKWVRWGFRCLSCAGL